MEKWKQYKETVYLVSDSGRVISISGTNKAVFIHPGKTRKGYLRVKIPNYGNCYVHRMVAEMFIENPENLPCINHKDVCKINNWYRNLEWCTVEANNKHAQDNNLGTLSIPCFVINKKGELSILGEFDSRSLAEQFMRGKKGLICINKNLYSQEYVSSIINKPRKRPHVYPKSVKRKLDDQQVLEIRILLKNENNYDLMIAKLYGVNSNTIRLIRTGVTYRDV